MRDDWKQVFPVQQNPITAINILLEPDATMLQHCEANNAVTRSESSRRGSLWTRRTVRTYHIGSPADLDKVYAAASLPPSGRHEAEAYKYDYAQRCHWADCLEADAGIAKLERHHPAVAPFTVDTEHGRVHAAHGDPAIDAQLIEYVSTFVPKKTGEHFSPHVTTYFRCWLNRLNRSPAAGVAVYQLGPSARRRRN